MSRRTKALWLLAKSALEAMNLAKQQQALHLAQSINAGERAHASSLVVLESLNELEEIVKKRGKEVPPKLTQIISFVMRQHDKGAVSANEPLDERWAKALTVVLELGKITDFQKTMDALAESVAEAKSLAEETAAQYGEPAPAPKFPVSPVTGEPVEAQAPAVAEDDDDSPEGMLAAATGTNNTTESKSS